MSSVIDLIQKFYIEHESSPILKERLGLIQDKVADLERKHDLSISANEVLRKEIAKHKADNERLQAENANLKKSFDSLNNRLHARPTESQYGLLLMLINGSVNTEKLTSMTERLRESVEFDVEELRVIGLLEVQQVLGERYCSLSQEGRRILSRDGII